MAQQQHRPGESPDVKDEIQTAPLKAQCQVSSQSSNDCRLKVCVRVKGRDDSRPLAFRPPLFWT